MLPSSRRCVLAVVVIGLLVSACAWAADVKPLFKADESRPADAIVLFDGKDLSEWVHAGSDDPAGWKVEKGYMAARGGNIVTKRQFTDFQLHVEFWLPLMQDAQAQGRANSGVYLQGSYEIQVLDSYGLKGDGGDCGAMYGVAPPMVNASRPPERWQSFDAVFHAPRFDAEGKNVSKARVTVFHNGVLIHENVEIPGPTRAAMRRDVTAAGPILLQDHGSPVRYRNIWIRPL